VDNQEDSNMGNQTEDPRRSGQTGGAQVGQPGEKKRTSQENAGSTEGGGTRNAGNSVEKLTEKSGEGNSIERMTDDGGAGRDQRAASQPGQTDDNRDKSQVKGESAKQPGEEKPGSRTR
jgi:hypothetical protein